MWIKTLLITLWIFVSFSSIGQEAKARKVIETLCSDSLYGRGYLKDGVNKAADFLKVEFQKSGLQPFIGDTTFFQPFELDVNTFPGVMEVKVDRQILKPGVDYIVDSESGGFDGELKLIEVDTIVLSKPELLDPIVENVVGGKSNAFYIDLVGMEPREAYRASYRFKTLATFGTVVFITDQKFTWSVGRKQLSHPVLHVKPGKINPKSALNIKIEAEMVKDFHNKNVAGYLPSKNKKAETIVFVAHYDHLGGMGTSPSTYFPGANDNASGTAMLISMADHFLEHPSKYNILFVAFAGEEAGLVGSEYFVKNGTMDLTNIKFLIDLDIMGSGEDGITVVNGSIHEKEFKLLQKINNKKNYLSQIKPRGETANSDHYYFHKEGVPSFFIYTMGPNKHYHDVFDTYEELSFAAYNNIVKLLVEFVERL